MSPVGIGRNEGLVMPSTKPLCSMMCRVISSGAVTDPPSQAQSETISGSIKAPAGTFSRSRNFRAFCISLKPLSHHSKLAEAFSLKPLSHHSKLAETFSMWFGSAQEIGGVKATYFDAQLLIRRGQPNAQCHR